MPFSPPSHLGESTDARPYRVRPRLWMAFVVPLVMMACSNVLLPVLAVNVAHLPTAMIFVAITVGTVVIFAPLFALFRWLRPVLFERRILDVPMSVLTFLPLALCYGVATATGAFDWRGELLIVVLAMSVQAGVTEELTFRGAAIFLVRSRLRELWVLIIPAAGFSSTHLLNLFSPNSNGLVPTLVQTAYTLLLGFSYYAVRRLSGSIFLGVALHAATNAFADFYVDDTPQLLGGAISLFQLFVFSALALGSVAAVILAVKYPRVPVVSPVYGVATAPAPPNAAA